MICSHCNIEETSATPKKFEIQWLRVVIPGDSAYSFCEWTCFYLWTRDKEHKRLSDLSKGTQTP